MDGWGPGAEVERQCHRNRSSLECTVGRQHAYIHSTPTHESFSGHYLANKTRQASAISSSRPELSPQTVIYRNLLSGGGTIVTRYFLCYLASGLPFVRLGALNTELPDLTILEAGTHSSGTGGGSATTVGSTDLDLDNLLLPVSMRTGLPRFRWVRCGDSSGRKEG